MKFNKLSTDGYVSSPKKEDVKEQPKPEIDLITPAGMPTIYFQGKELKQVTSVEFLNSIRGKFVVIYSKVLQSGVELDASHGPMKITVKDGFKTGDEFKTKEIEGTVHRIEIKCDPKEGLTQMVEITLP